MQTESLSRIVEGSLRLYGEEVVLQRAVPDFRDGLKPVHRCVLWALYNLGLRPSGPFKKSARTVGEVIGKYHPHGDCLRGDTKVPLLSGQFTTIKQLSDKHAGNQWVLAFDESTGRLVPALAHSWRVGQIAKKMYSIEFTTGETIECTANHPFFVQGLGWTEAKNLKEGSSLIGGTLELDREYLTVSLNTGFRRAIPAYYLNVIDKIEVVSIEPEEFYDFTVDTHHNMIVYTSKGDQTGNFVVAHNSSTYDAMVGIAGTKNEKGMWATRNCPVPLVEGFGNWGDNIDPPAAYRYTEARLSKAAYDLLLDPVYLAVTEYVANFSGDDKLPVVLPAKLPMMLLNGSVSIAFGIKAECPPFKPKGILELVIQCLQGVKITPKLCLKHLEFNFAFGGECISPTKDIHAFFQEGCGSLVFRPFIKVDEAKRVVSIVSSSPGLTSANSWETLAKNLNELKEVQSALDVSDKKGFCFEVSYAKGLTKAAILAIIYKYVDRTQSYDLGTTERSKDKVEFFRTTVMDIIREWCEWRVVLEKKAVNHLISLEEVKLKRLELTLLAALNLKIIVASLKVDDSAEYLSKHLKVTREEADQILSLQVRQLKALEVGKLKASIKEINTSIKGLRSALKDLPSRIVQNLKSLDVNSL